MNFLTKAAINRLNDEGYLVVAPNAPQPLPIYDMTSAVSYVRAEGHTVIKTAPVAQPRWGREYIPTRTRAISRTPIASPNGRVRYATPMGSTQDVSLLSWHRWVKKTRAVMS